MNDCIEHLLTLYEDRIGRNATALVTAFIIHVPLTNNKYALDNVDDIYFVMIPPSYEG